MNRFVSMAKRCLVDRSTTSGPQGGPQRLAANWSATRVLFSAVFVLLVASPASAQTLYWYPPSLSGAAWNGSEENWRPNADGSGAAQAWAVSGNTFTGAQARFNQDETYGVVLSGTAQTVWQVFVDDGHVTFGDAIARSLTFSTPNNSTWNEGFIVADGASATVSSATTIARATASTNSIFFYKAGSGVLYLGNAASVVPTRLIANDGAFDMVGTLQGSLTGGGRQMIFANDNPGVFQVSVDMNKNIGAADGEIRWDGSNASGGFSARTAPVNVTLNSNATLNWASTTWFIQNDRTLAFGSTTSDNTLTFTNAVGLNGDVRTVRVTDNPDSAADRTIFSGVWSGAGSSGLLKTGDGILQLNAANTYVGTTSVTGGTLALGAAGSIANSSAITVGTGTTLDVSAVGGWTVGASQSLSGTGTVVGDTTIAGSLNPGNSPGILTFEDALTLEGTTTMEIDGLVRGTEYDGVNTGDGLLTYGGDLAFDFGATFDSPGVYTFDLFDIGGGGAGGSFANVTLAGLYSGALSDQGGGVWERVDGNNTWTFSQATGDLTFVVVPEPSGLVFVACGSGIAFAALRRRRRG